MNAGIRFYFVTCMALFVVLFTTACKTPPPETALDIRALMSAGDCARIMGHLSEDSQSAEDRGALAVCALAAGPDKNGKQRAVQLITGPDAAMTTEATAAMLDLAALYPEGSPSVQREAIAVALGIAGYGPLSAVQVVHPGTDAAQMLTVAMLRFSSEVYFRANFTEHRNEVIDIWHGCQYLLQEKYMTSTDYLAWQLFTALAEFALRVFDPFNKTETGYEVMRATITTLEQNGTIGVAARCDLGSPYEKLKSVLSKDTALLGPLERAVAVATGCTRGRYAPMPQQ